PWAGAGPAIPIGPPPSRSGCASTGSASTSAEGRRHEPGLAMKTRPQKVGRFELVRELGRGMMGVVYEAIDPALGRTVALKTIHSSFAAASQRAAFERRFLVEARIAGRLSHPGIVVVHDVGRDERTGLLFIAFERLLGETLDALLARGERPSWRESLRIVQDVASALQHAHERGVIHRDIKPANIMILPTGQPKVMDFGIAKLEATHLTAAGQFFGTPLYMAPEQALNQKVDGRTDIFSLGAVAYGLLTGRLAFEADNVIKTLGRVVHQDPPPPTRLEPGLPSEADYLIARALAKAPEDRYAEARWLAEDIEDVTRDAPPRHRSGWVPPPPRLPPRSGHALVAVLNSAAFAPTITVCSGLDEADLPELGLERNRWRPSARTVALVGVLLLAAAGLVWSRRTPPAPADLPAAPPSVPAPVPSATPVFTSAEVRTAPPVAVPAPAAAAFEHPLAAGELQ